MVNTMREGGRRSIRLAGYDYTQAGAYFVTICTPEMRHLFGAVRRRRVVLSPVGEVADTLLRFIPVVRPQVVVDEYIVMPHHLHAILVNTKPSAPPSERIRKNGMPNGPARGSLGATVGQYKSAVTRQVRALEGEHPFHVWQRDFWEHIIRSQFELHCIRRYIRNNPAQWSLDHPETR